MSWDSSRPVPWKRLTTEFALIAVVIVVISWVVSHNHKASNYIAILLAGGVYLVFGAVLAKFGYARKSLKQMRVEAAAQPARVVGKVSAPSQRPKPAPTSRTSSGPSNRPQKKKR